MHRARRRAETGGDVEVSLKRLHEYLGEKERAVQSFLQEAEIAARMDHDNIARFYEVGRLDGAYFIAMEYIEGRSLRELLVTANKAGEPLPLAVILSMVCQLCEALEYLHNRRDDNSGTHLGLIHRDISPANVLVTPWGQVKLIDLGIAKSEISELKTGTGVIKGKYGYMAPEVLHGGATTKSVDIFAIGVVLWELLTAKRLFSGQSDLDTIERVKSGVVKAPSTVVPAYSPYLDDVVLRALSRNPAQRWPSAAAMGVALRAVATMQHEPIEPSIIADWMVLGRTTSTPSDTPTGGDTNQTTAVVEKAPRTLPVVPSVLPRGTREFRRVAKGSNSVPALRAPTSKVEPPLPRSKKPLIIAISVVLNLALLAWIVAGLSDESVRHADNTPAVHDLSDGGGVDTVVDVGPTLASLKRTPIREPEPQPQPRAKPIVEPRPKAKPVTRPIVKPRPKPVANPKRQRTRLELPEVSVTQVRWRSGPFPRSRSTRKRYSARLCINRRGRVVQVTPLTGPKRLYRRIKRMLGYGAYFPYKPNGRATGVCFVLHDRLRRWRRRR